MRVSWEVSESSWSSPHVSHALLAQDCLLDNWQEDSEKDTREKHGDDSRLNRAREVLSVLLIRLEVIEHQSDTSSLFSGEWLKALQRDVKLDYSTMKVREIVADLIYNILLALRSGHIALKDANIGSDLREPSLIRHYYTMLSIDY